MRITAMLAFWDEPPERLYRCVNTACQLADLVLAADGPFADFPHEGDRSEKACYEAIEQGAADADAKALITPGQVWKGQVAKRDHIMRCAGVQGTDWFFPMDADETIAECDTLKVRAELVTTEAESLQVPRYTPANPEATWEPDSTQNEVAGGLEVYHRLFRYLKNMRVEHLHWIYTGERPGVECSECEGDDSRCSHCEGTGYEVPPKRVALWGPRAGGDMKRFPPCKDDVIKSQLLFEHHQLWRSGTYRHHQMIYRSKTAEHVTHQGFEA